MSGSLLHRSPLRERTRGRWRGILAAHGIDPRYLTGKNGPCPMCGGKDRWRFTDFNSDGYWICNQCGHGTGTDLLLRCTGLPFKEVARRIEAVLPDAQAEVTRRRSEQQTRASLNAMWRHARPVGGGDTTDRWMQYRGIELRTFPACLRTGRAVRYYDGDTFTEHPAMLAMVTGPDGKPATIHRTYLTSDGHKAAVPEPRKLYSAVPKGSAVRLARPLAELGVAEGIETAIAASILFKVPAWSTICASMLKDFEPSAEVTTLVIFGDNDVNHVGQTAAHALAARLANRLQVEVRIPDRPGSDWNDVLLEQQGQHRAA